MNRQEYNSLIFELTLIIKPFNQLLYQILILITLYLFFNKITNDSINYNNNIIYYHDTFLILFAVIVLFIDYFIWNNITQTALFISILIIYIYYNLQNIKLISIFIQNTGYLNNNTDTSKQNKTNQYIENNINNINNVDTNHNIACDVPLDISNIKLHIDEKNIPSPFDINNNNNELNDVYKIDKQNTYITDVKYAEIIQNMLF